MIAALGFGVTVAWGLMGIACAVRSVRHREPWFAPLAFSSFVFCGLGLMLLRHFNCF